MCQIFNNTAYHSNFLQLFHILCSDLRTEPLYQALVGLSLSQGLTHLLLMLSYELSQVAWLCYSLGLLFHYSTLVTLTWMAALPVVMAIEVFKRLWYEKAWIIAPFATFSTSKSTKVIVNFSCAYREILFLICM